MSEMSEYLSNDHLRERILSHLCNEPELDGFVIKKSDCALLKKDNLGWKRIHLISYTSVCRKREQLSLMVNPHYTRRFSVLHEWFDKNFSIISPRDRRWYDSVRWKEPRTAKYRNSWHLVDFLRTGEDFDLDYNRLKEVIIEESIPFFTQYDTLQGMYDECILPILLRKINLPIGSFDWSYQYIVLTKIVCPEEYVFVKHLVSERIEMLHSRGEPNVERYYSIWPRILEYIDSHDF